MQLKVSVIVPVYNGEQYVEKCCQQLANQTLKEMEFILVDDGSTDRTPEICDAMCERYSNCRVFHQKNSGVSAARNRGIEAAEGEFLGFVDVDDQYDPDMFECLYCAVISNELDMISMEPIGEAGALTTLENRSQMLTMFLQNKIGMSVCSKLFRRRLFEDHLFPEGVQIHEDCMAVYRGISLSQRIGVLNVCKYHYIRHEDSNSCTPKFVEKYFDAISVDDVICQEVLEQYPELHVSCLQRKAMTYLRITKIFYMRGHPKEFRNQIQALKHWLKTIPLKDLHIYFPKKTEQMRWILCCYFLPLFVVMVNTIDKK